MMILKLATVCILTAALAALLNSGVAAEVALPESRSSSRTRGRGPYPSSGRPGLLSRNRTVLCGLRDDILQ